MELEKCEFYLTQTTIFYPICTCTQQSIPKKKKKKNKKNSAGAKFYLDATEMSELEETSYLS